MARVDLIVPTFNGTDYLLECLRSLSKSTFTDYNLIVVDDGSTVPVRDAVLAIDPATTVLRNEVNSGLTSAFNRAIGASDAEYVVLLNNDTLVDAHWLENLVACADRHPECGSIASKLRLTSDRQIIHSAGDTYSVRGMPGNRGVWLEDFGQYDAEEDVFSACAGAALYRRAALSAVRLGNGDIFDTRLFMYCEDVDLAWRLQSRGWRCVFAPDALVYHHLSATGGGNLASYYVSRNIWRVLATSVPRSLVQRYRWRIAMYHGGRLLRNVRAAREPAARRALAGSLAGLTAFVLSRPRPPEPEPDELDRIHSLLLHW
jgi:GT2 family glycosyltransferase